MREYKIVILGSGGVGEWKSHKISCSIKLTTILFDSFRQKRPHRPICSGEFYLLFELINSFAPQRKKLQFSVGDCLLNFFWYEH